MLNIGSSFCTKKGALLESNDTYKEHWRSSPRAMTQLSDMLHEHCQLQMIGGTFMNTLHILSIQTICQSIVRPGVHSTHSVHTGVDIWVGCSFHTYCTHCKCTHGRVDTRHLGGMLLPWHRVRPRLWWFSGDSAHSSFFAENFLLSHHRRDFKLVYSQLQQGHRCSALSWAVKKYLEDCILKRREKMHGLSLDPKDEIHKLFHTYQNILESEELRQEVVRVVP